MKTTVFKMTHIDSKEIITVEAKGDGLIQEAYSNSSMDYSCSLNDNGDVLTYTNTNGEEIKLDYSTLLELHLFASHMEQDSKTFPQIQIINPPKR